MKKLLFPVIAFFSFLISCVNGGTKSELKANDSLVLTKDTSKMVRVVSSGGYDTMVHKKDVERVQHEHYSRFYEEGWGGSFHSSADGTHYSCSHRSHMSHYSSLIQPSNDRK